ncbi:MAG: hypothetical protein KF901_22450 [Myxococcales bacterium]|nr:hypothetical protein [Myxococcales bacterium]
MRYDETHRLLPNLTQWLDNDCVRACVLNVLGPRLAANPKLANAVTQALAPTAGRGLTFSEAHAALAALKIPSRNLRGEPFGNLARMSEGTVILGIDAGVIYAVPPSPHAVVLTTSSTPDPRIPHFVDTWIPPVGIFDPSPRAPEARTHLAENIADAYDALGRVALWIAD